ncbi:MAG: hypothetical protein EPO16_00105, partial [Dehalococcoidia bacterium]
MRASSPRNPSPAPRRCNSNETTRPSAGSEPPSRSAAVSHSGVMAASEEGRALDAGIDLLAGPPPTSEYVRVSRGRATTARETDASRPITIGRTEPSWSWCPTVAGLDACALATPRLASERRSEMQAVIAAGGSGSRLGPLTKDTAPVMLPVGGRPFIDYLLARLVAEGIDDVILLLDHQAEQVERHVGTGERHGVRIRTMRDGQFPLEVMGAVKQAEEILETTFCLVRGDSYPRVDIQAMHAAFVNRMEPAMMAVHANRDPRYLNDIDLNGTSVG